MFCWDVMWSVNAKENGGSVMVPGTGKCTVFPLFGGVCD